MISSQIFLYILFVLIKSHSEVWRQVFYNNQVKYPAHTFQLIFYQGDVFFGTLKWNESVTDLNLYVYINNTQCFDVSRQAVYSFTQDTRIGPIQTFQFTARNRGFIGPGFLTFRVYPYRLSSTYVQYLYQFRSSQQLYFQILRNFFKFSFLKSCRSRRCCLIFYILLAQKQPEYQSNIIQILKIIGILLLCLCLVKICIAGLYYIYKKSSKNNVRAYEQGSRANLGRVMERTNLEERANPRPVRAQDNLPPVRKRANIAHARERANIRPARELQNCSICQEANMNVVLPCLHRFHKNCIREWFQRNKTCLICRMNTEPVNIIATDATLETEI